MSSPEPPAAASPETSRVPEQSDQRRPERLCPNCGAFLIELKCKLLCPNRDCGYYMSCSDFY
jgi:hypothetical protein